MAADALHSNGIKYRLGHGVEINYSKAIEYYTAAAQKGHARAMVSLGEMYRKALGVSQDYAQAFKWYKKAKDLGNLTGYNNLGLSYRNGFGVSQNYAKAYELYRFAADRGYSLSMSNLGNMYRDGLFIQQSNEEAFFWYSLAVSRGFNKAISRRDIAVSKLTALQSRAIDRRVATWEPKQVDAGSKVASTAARNSRKTKRSFKANWEGFPNPIEGIVELFQKLKSGKFSFNFPNSLYNCTGTTFTNTDKRGVWSFACDNKITASGSLITLGLDQGAIGKGTDSLGRKIKFEIGALISAAN